MSVVPNGNFWIGSDNQVYVSGAGGVNAAGQADANTNQYWSDRGYGLIADPNPQGQVLGSSASGSLTGGGSGGGSGGGGGTIDPNAVALYDQGIGQANNQIGRLDVQQGNALGQLLGQYNSGVSGLNDQKARTTRDYDANKVQSTQENIQANSNIDFQTGRQANSLQRLLGSRGAGSSSASRVAAPYAAALQGTQQRGQVKDAFSKNMGALDTSFSDYNTDWDKSKTSLDQGYEDEQKTVKSSIAQKRSDLLQTLAQLTSQRQLAATGNAGASVAAAQPFLNQINTLGGEIDRLGTARQIAVTNPTYNAPDLAKYNYDKPGAAQVGNNSALTDTISPYLSLLLGKKKQQLA